MNMKIKLIVAFMIIGTSFSARAEGPKKVTCGDEGDFRIQLSIADPQGRKMNFSLPYIDTDFVPAFSSGKEGYLVMWMDTCSDSGSFASLYISTGDTGLTTLDGKPHSLKTLRGAISEFQSEGKVKRLKVAVRLAAQGEERATHCSWEDESLKENGIQCDVGFASVDHEHLALLAYDLTANESTTVQKRILLKLMQVERLVEAKDKQNQEHVARFAKIREQLDRYRSEIY